MFDEHKWREMGQVIGYSLAQYNAISQELINIKLRKKAERLRIKKIQSINRTKNNFLI